MSGQKKLLNRTESINRTREGRERESSEWSIKGCVAEGSSSCSLSFEMLQSLRQRSRWRPERRSECIVFDDFRAVNSVPRRYWKCCGAKCVNDTTMIHFYTVQSGWSWKYSLLWMIIKNYNSYWDSGKVPAAITQQQKRYVHLQIKRRCAYLRTWHSSTNLMNYLNLLTIWQDRSGSNGS